ncbi:MAG: OmpA family protein [Gemmatimonadota bacterium]|nr:OmpA family protein [Gemmatimonadota bacterium]
MMNVRAIAVMALAVPLVTGCVSNRKFNRTIAEQNAALETERTARTSADEALQSDVQSLRTDVQNLRTELQNLRTEFGAKITAMEEGLKFALPVNFAFDDATIRPEDVPALDRFARVVQNYYQGSKITVEGFADPAGTMAYNRVLSTRRAESVRAHLMAAGVNPDLIEAIGYGETRQVVMGAERDDPGAEKNRRVVFVVESRGEPTMAEANTLQ